MVGLYFGDDGTLRVASSAPNPIQVVTPQEPQTLKVSHALGIVEYYFGNGCNWRRLPGPGLGGPCDCELQLASFQCLALAPIHLSCRYNQSQNNNQNRRHPAAGAPVRNGGNS